MAGAVACGLGPAQAASSGTVVSATVPSATNVDASGCATGTPDVTDFGTVLPGSTNTTGADCTVLFGSSNDTARLDLYQRDGTGTAMSGGWGAQASGTGAFLYGVDAVDTSTAWAVGGGIYATTNGGVTWSNQASGTTELLVDVSAASATRAWAVGSNGAIVRSTGATWTAQNSTVGVWLHGVAAGDANSAWAVGDSGTIVHTADGGTSWVAQASNTGAELDAVAAVDASTAWAVGAGGVVTRTTNGGATWTATNPTTTPLLGVTAVSASIAWAVGWNGTILRTIDGGASWATMPSTIGATLTNVSAWDATRIWAVSVTGQIEYSTDGGATWRIQPSGTTQTLTDVVATGAATAWSTGWNGTILMTPMLPVADFSAGVNDWSAGSNVFAACLRAVSNGATTSTGPTPAATWAPNTGCSTSGAWNAVPATMGAGSKVAQATTSSTTAARADLRFGFRAATNQAPGTYLADLVFSVTAPNV
ncbi:MAG: hypothetical protein JWM98_2512 [Thermoleophilia bacterium]|nr:hypothetical protein [Thermoleophilia bacterium]